MWAEGICPSIRPHASKVAVKGAMLFVVFIVDVMTRMSA